MDERSETPFTPRVKWQAFSLGVPTYSMARDISKWERVAKLSASLTAVWAPIKHGKINNLRAPLRKRNPLELIGFPKLATTNARDPVTLGPAGAVMLADDDCLDAEKAGNWRTKSDDDVYFHQSRRRTVRCGGAGWMYNDIFSCKRNLWPIIVWSVNEERRVWSPRRMWWCFCGVYFRGILRHHLDFQADLTFITQIKCLDLPYTVTRKRRHSSGAKFLIEPYPIRRK